MKQIIATIIILLLMFPVLVFDFKSFDGCLMIKTKLGTWPMEFLISEYEDRGGFFEMCIDSTMSKHTVGYKWIPETSEDKQ